MAVLKAKPAKRKGLPAIAGEIRKAGWLLVCLLTWFSPAPIRAEEPQVSEYQVKAAFVANFPKYIEWPPATFTDVTNQPIVVAVLGSSKLADELTKITIGKTIAGRPLVLNILAKEEDITRDCHILFIGASEQRRVPAILEKLRQTTVLTVGESDDFLAAGGIINLAKQGKKVSLEVNLAAANQAQLKISSKLLSLARVQKDQAH